MTTSTSEPEIVERPDQPYAAIRVQVTMSRIADAADKIRDLLVHLDERGIAPLGAPFLKYDVLGPGDAVEIEAGVPVKDVGEGADKVAFAVLPGGRYAVMSHVGPYDELADATKRLLEWGAEQDVRWDMDERDGAQAWVARLEIYTSNPVETPDPKDLVTDLAFRLA